MKYSEQMEQRPSVLLLGDTHGNPEALRQAFEQAHHNGCEAIIQLGDYGYGWSVGPDGLCDFSYLTAAMVERTGIPFFWLDGNHENFDRLYELPLNEAGHRPVLEGVTHLPRGSVITFGETTFLAFGGAYSVDKPHRKVGKSWWPQETASHAEIEKAMGQKADVLLSHDAPFGIQDESEYEWLRKVFGDDAVTFSLVNQRAVAAVLEASGAKECFHGHLHRSWERVLNDVVVRGLDKESEPKSTYLLTV